MISDLARGGRCLYSSARSATHEGGTPVPDNYLGQLAEATATGLASSPPFVFHALVGALRQRGIDNPDAAVSAMLPEMKVDQETWQQVLPRHTNGLLAQR
ncbi:hypothetical protein Raf01_42210 [Rugosimonospora africana]|uniref:Uncharacterized protein n=1 Tax=Rugosimonospora africana TaxID=556532 RepID=A0A8J3QT87_9ACTN|nr:hypothetical protein Raf01_42210 [Rugosimonospora africana]